jgi:PTS system glucose-specific IIC component
MIRLLSPMTGTVIPLETVPDSAFSRKLLGDGVAIIPTEGTIVSPVDGTLSAISHTLHAYIFTSEEGLEILVHVGLQSVGLQGRGFYPLVPVGQKVRAGEPVADVDLVLLQKKGVPLYTPVVICEGAEKMTLASCTGPAEAGTTQIITLN